MPRLRAGRPLKHWRYVGAYGSELMFCAGDARIGPVRQRFWAVATPDGRILERTSIVGSAGLRMEGDRVAIDAPGLRARLDAERGKPFEVASRHGKSYIWTRKTPVLVSGLIELHGRPFQIECEGLMDESAGYHARHTVWKWSAGVGRSTDGRPLVWNLVTGVHDAEHASERTVWVDDEPREVAPVAFADDLSHVGDLAFSEWSAREDNTNALVVRSRYRQPFGTFQGSIDGVEVAQGYGVMESHDVWW